MRLLGTTLALLLAGILSATTVLGAEPKRPVFLEAEGFGQLGGWVVDQQFMDQMGSPMLLAHGMGVPVKDATTSVEFPAPGTYRVWVRTRDWVAPWNVPGAPGKFQLLIDGKPLTTTFGTEGANWHWQDGGTVHIDKRNVAVGLRDLTGFDGRCDAIVFSADEDYVPPDKTEALAALRREVLGLSGEPENAGQFDLVVVGGGMAGTCAAISAARLGLAVALVQDRPVLGGNNSSEVRVHLGGEIHQPPYPAIGGVVRELDSGLHGNAQPAENYADGQKLGVVRAEKRIRLFLNTHVNRVQMQDNKIVAVIGQNIRTGKTLRFPALLFADCTGDGTIGYLAGADFHYGRESRDQTAEPLAPEKADRITMGTSIMWYSAETDTPTTFPDCPWAVQFNEQSCQRAISGNWNWETGFRIDQIEQFEYVRDHGLRAVYGNWSFQKNRARDGSRYRNRKLSWVAFVGGKRESRRLLGDVVLRQQDIMGGRKFPDASLTTTWTIDLHYPIQSDKFPGAEFRSVAKHVKIEPYPIPYRCLYSRNVDNLFMAGRHISVTHVALGTVRVMRTTGMMGEVVGMAAAVCSRFDVEPRGVYAKHLPQLQELMTRGVGKLPVPTPPGPPKPPAWLGKAGANVARTAKVGVSSNYTKADYPAENVNDGRISYTDNGLRFVSDAELPGWVELAWEAPQSINAVRIVTGQSSGSAGPSTPIRDFVLQTHDGTGFRDIPGTKVVGNQQADYHATFPTIRSNRVRLLVTATPGDLTRIWEIELYHRPPEAAEAGR